MPGPAKPRRLLTRLALALGTLLALIVLAIAATLWWSVPSRNAQADIPGLTAPVAISLDAHGIPWIKAASDEDAAAAIGYLHARDRLFEMELMRRTASGRLSEIAGSVTLRTDRALRTLGLRRRAEAELPMLDPATRAMLDGYARGANAWIAERGRFAAPEFLLLGAPEPWTAVDSLLWGKTLALYLAGNWRADLIRASLAAKLSPAVQRTLWPDWTAIPRPDASLDTRRASLDTRFAAAIPKFPEPFTLPDEASNEWAVDGRHSTSGAPLLAGDPHLGLTFPSIWYLAHIETPGGVLAGATAPGVPFLILGHNGHVAWTFTTAGADTQDVFVETPLPGGTYATPDGPRPFLVHEERIHVRGAPDDVLTVRETRHGPVLSDLDPPPDGKTLAVAIAALQATDTSATGILALDRAQTLAQVQAAAGQISAPVQNLLAADRNAIGQFTTGRVPIRAGDGATPVDGADGRHDWQRLAGADELPHIVAPASGRLLNANEPVAPRDFPVNMGVDGFGDWRARRIRELLDARPLHSPADFAAMQIDITSVFARQVLPALLATDPADDGARRALEALRAWDGTMAMDRPEPLLFNAWMRRFTADMMGGLGIDPTQSPPLIDVVGQALGRGQALGQGAALCGGDCKPLLAKSLGEALQSLGPDWPQKRWGELHQATFAHPLLGRLPLLGPAFTWSIPQPGDDSTLYRGGMRAPGWESIHGSSFRGVYDLADLDASLYALAPGESGNPFSRDAGSLLLPWRDEISLRLGPQPGQVSGHIDLNPAEHAIGR